MRFIVSLSNLAGDKLKPWRTVTVVGDSQYGAVLWHTPPEVAAQLNAISDSYVVSVVSGSKESGHVTLITELGKIDAHLVNRTWRVDAGPIIENDAANA